jgi:hypothetical protein
MSTKFAAKDLLTYTRTNGEQREGVVLNVIDLGEPLFENQTYTYPGRWPKPRHCRFVYRLEVEGVGPRTVCEHRLSRK